MFDWPVMEHDRFEYALLQRRSGHVFNPQGTPVMKKFTVHSMRHVLFVLLVHANSLIVCQCFIWLYVIISNIRTDL